MSRGRLLLAAAALAGCGYTMGVARPAGVRSVALPLVDNQTDRRDLEWTLTEALRRELAARGFAVVTTGGADATCHVRVREVRETTAAQDPLDAPVVGTLTVVADVVLRDRAGRTLVDRRDLRETDTYVVAAADTEDAAGARAARVLARRIADALEPGF